MMRFPLPAPRSSAAILIGLSALLAGCGQKGPLYLPEPRPPVGAGQTPAQEQAPAKTDAAADTPAAN